MDTLPLSLQPCVLQDVILEEEVGRGAHGRVLAATWEGASVAVKHIHSLFNDVASDVEYDKLRQSFLKECERSSQIRHPNIVRFLGIYLAEGDPVPRLVMERLSCNLDQLLTKHLDIPEGIKYNIIHGVSLGIRFLHTRRPAPIIHRDLSSKNVLVSSALEGKIGDLGTARFVDERRQSQMTRAPGTADFMPPEVLTDRPSYSVSVDLFSFGCVMLHTLSHEWPTPRQSVIGDKKTRELIALSELQRRETYMQKLVNRPSSLPAEVKDLIIQCLSNYPEERPKIQIVTDLLADIKSQHTSTLSLTLLDVQVQLQKTKEGFADAYNKMEEVYAFLFPSPRTPSKSARPAFSQGNRTYPSPSVNAKLSSISEEGRHPSAANSSMMFVGQPHSLQATAGPTLASPPAITTTDTTTTSPTTSVRSDRLFQSLTTTLIPKDQNFFDQRSKSMSDDKDGSLVKSKLVPKDKALSDSGPLENNDQPVGNEEPVAVKEKDEVFTATPDDAKQLDEQTERTTQPAVTPPATSAVTVTSVGDVMKHDSSPAAVRKATPNTQPLPPSTSSVIPSVSTANNGKISQPRVAKPTVTAPVNPPDRVTSDSVQRTKKIIPQLESKYFSLLNNMPENFESSLAHLQQILSDEQICDILSVPEARACNQKILSCLIERVTCEEDVLDLCSNLEKITGSPALVGIVEELRTDIMESIQAKSSNGKQKLLSTTDQPWSKADKGDHMTYSRMASACLATQGHASSPITQELRGHWKDYNMKWDQVDNLTDKSMSTCVVELDGKVYAVLENTSARFLNVRMYSCEANAWTSLPPLQYGGASLAVIPNKGQLLAIGGIYHPDTNCSNISKKVYMWDEKYETWLTVYPDMPTPRCYCCSVGHKSMVIVAGGTVQYEGHRNTDAVEILMAHDTNPRESRWFAVKSMPTLLYQYMVPVVIADTLYIGCGFRKGLPFSTFNIVSAHIPTLLKSTNRDMHPTWNRLPELPYTSFSISQFDGCLVAFGGEHVDVTAPRRLDGGHRLNPVPLIYVYKPATHDWEQVGEIPYAYSLGCAVRLQENKIMFVGSFIDPSCVTDKDLLTTCPCVTIMK